MKKVQITLLTLVALAAAITVGCGDSHPIPTYSKLPFVSNRTADPATPLFLMNLDGSNVTPVPYNLEGVYSPSISADLKKVAFVSFPNVWVINSDGTGQTQLTTATDSDADGFSYIFYARISPDGKKIIYSYWDGSNEIVSVWIMNVDGTEQHNLVSPLPEGMTGCYSGSFSADSRRVVFSCYGDSADGIYLVDTDGTHQSTVVTADSFLDTPMFSPDGKKILFVGFNFVPAAVRRPSGFTHKPTFASARSAAHRQAAPGGINSQGVFSINPDGSNGVLIVPNAYEAEILNSILYYTIWDSEVGGQISKSNLDGTGGVLLSDGTSDDRLDLSSD